MVESVVNIPKPPQNNGNSATANSNTVKLPTLPRADTVRLPGLPPPRGSISRTDEAITGLWRELAWKLPGLPATENGAVVGYIYTEPVDQQRAILVNVLSVLKTSSLKFPNIEERIENAAKLGITIYACGNDDTVIAGDNFGFLARNAATILVTDLKNSERAMDRYIELRVAEEAEPNKAQKEAEYVAVRDEILAAVTRWTSPPQDAPPPLVSGLTLAKR